MNKLIEAHLKVLSSLKEIVKIEKLIPEHVSITSKYMLLFHRWCVKNGWKWHNNGYWYKLDYPNQWPTPHTVDDSELIQMFLSETENFEKKEECKHPDWAMSKHGSTEMCNKCGKTWG